MEVHRAYRDVKGTDRGEFYLNKFKRKKERQLRNWLDLFRLARVCEKIRVSAYVNAYTYPICN